MRQFLNENSAALLLIAIGVFLALQVWEYRRRPKALAILGVVVVVIGAGYWQARGGPSNIARAAELDALVATGRPVLLEAYSDTCIACLVSRPTVDGLERDLAGTAGFVRVNVRDEVGRGLVRRFGIRATPTFVVFGPNGEEVYRQDGGLADGDRLRDTLTRPGGTD
ncbi:MAG: thioredoxin family protein [SAR202 cluster bacterium]|nr:thioredoxin family protein [SAR202 cluster bacterium]